MKSASSIHAFIEPVKSNIKRPLWSVLIPTYNCATFLRETIESVLSQNINADNMEIIVIDDYSTLDDPKKVVEEVGKGRVKFVRQTQNVGKVRNYETGLQLSRGIYIHQLHGDDRVLPGFYKEMEILLHNSPKADAAFCRTVYIDEVGRWKQLTGMLQENDGIVNKLNEILFVKQVIQTPSMVVKRKVYEELGAFDRRFDCMEDWEMWFRISGKFRVATTNKVLAEYRTHSNNATHIYSRNGKDKVTYSLLKEIMNKEMNVQNISVLIKKRKTCESERLLQSLYKGTSSFSAAEKLQTIIEILKLDFSFKNIYNSIKALKIK